MIRAARFKVKRLKVKRSRLNGIYTKRHEEVADCRGDSGAAELDAAKPQGAARDCGRPMVEWVWRAAAASGLMDPVVVATDSDEVARHAGVEHSVDDDIGGVPKRVGPCAGSGADRLTPIFT
jgi:hypothetical protein